jgi:ketosteroid isomerase-like protein
MSVSETDRYYSALSAKSGRNAAFIAMFDSAGVMLTGHSMPIKGLNHISELLSSRSDTSYTLTWEPEFESVAQSGELGYTYGTYRVTDKLAKRLLEEGTYTTIWRKNAQGEWKAVLDTGNEGLKPENK